MFRARLVSSNLKILLNCNIAAVSRRNEVSSSLAKEAPVAKPKADETKSNMFSADNITFGNMTTLAMLRAMVVLRICSIPGFADNASRVLDLGQRYLGKRLFSSILRLTAYGQFVAGDKINEIKAAAKLLGENNIAQMLLVPMEAPEGEISSSREESFDLNVTKALTCVDISQATKLHDKDALMHLKVTALISFDTLCAVSEIFSQDQYSIDGFLNWIESGCSDNDLPIIASKLPKQDIKQFADGIKKLFKILAYAEQQNVRILIDAEHTWINPAIHHLGLALMKIFNSQRPTVYLTYQAYLKETRNLLRNHEEECRRANVYFALKLVRGAYLVPETKRYGSHPPYLCGDWEETNKNYNQCLKDLLAMDPLLTRIVVATHNETSIRLAVDYLRKTSQSGMKINVSFAQTFGMSDYLSYTLGQMGFDVYKSVPYGSIEETLPYLSRRVKENCLVLCGIRKDMIMFRAGLKTKFKQKISL